MAGNREQAWRAWGGAAGDRADKNFGRDSSVLSDVAPLQRSSIVKKLNPHQKGALRLAERFGDRLVCVRYRTDPESGRRFTTAEIVIEERAPIAPAPRHSLVRVGWKETELRRAIKEVGGVWLHDKKLWQVPRDAVKQLRIGKRVVREGA
ncbi:MAG: hypothetical protein KIT42_09885 [Rhodocyclaceae bacterium]|nr:hypothetical protein [Rhodocyclaceae bacterium]